MAKICDFCGKSFERDDRALLSEKFCPHCITQRLKESGATFFNQKKITLTFNDAGYVIVNPK
ncbi:MAG: hypothetical protein ACQET8_21940 [Bacillota bacterium]